MSRYRRIEIVEPSHNLFIRETSIFTPKTSLFPHFFPSLAFEDELDFALDLFHPTLTPALIDFTSPFHDLEDVTDLVQIERAPHRSSTRRVHHLVDRFGTKSYLQCISDRVSELELSLDKLVNAKPNQSGVDRKYTWTTEVNGPEKYGLDRKYQWTAEIKGGRKEKEKGGRKKKDKGGIEKNYKWAAEIKDKREDFPITRTYMFKASTGDAVECIESEKKEKKKNKKKNKKCDNGVPLARVVEIEEPSNQGVLVLRQAFAKRAGAGEKSKGKRKELSLQDAAMMIQVTFRAYLIRRSQVLRALRALAVAKAKLKEIRALFNNFAYRRRLSRDAEECQRFSEKIIILLLTVDTIEGADLMVRVAKRSMVDELEPMLDVVDPHEPSGGKSLSMRRTFDMPDGVIQKELAAGVSQVVQMLDHENGTFEACL